MNVAGKEGEAREKTMTSWAERALEVVRRYQSVVNIDETSSFW